MTYTAQPDSSAGRMIAALQRLGHAMTATQLAIHGEVRRGDVAVRLRQARRAGLVVRRISRRPDGSKEAVWALRGMQLAGKTRPEDYKRPLGGRVTVGLAVGYDPRYQCGPEFAGGEFSRLRIGEYADAAASCAARAK